MPELPVEEQVMVLDGVTRLVQVGRLEVEEHAIGPGGRGEERTADDHEPREDAVRNPNAHTSTSPGTDPNRGGSGARGEFYRGRARWVKSVAWALALLVITIGPVGALGAEELDRARKDEGRLAAIIALVDEGRFAEAEEALAASGEVARLDARWLNLHGLAVAGQGRHAEAIGYYEAGLRKDPSLAALHRNLAISLVEAGGRGRALTEFQQATELDPRDAEAWLGLCTLQIRLRRGEDARASWRQLYRLAPSDPRTWRAAAEFAELTGDRETALEAWGWLEENEPDAESARRLALVGPAEEALARYRDCIERDPGAVDCRERATQLAMEAGETADAVGYSEPALMDLTEAGYLNLLLAGLNSSAIREVPGWVDRRPPATAEAWGVVALVHRDQGRPEPALEAVRTGLEVAETADLYNLLGVLRVEAGDVAGARRAWLRALELDADHEVARSNLEEHPERP
jgi:tetratricopeptide (TPR) repeat protein